MAFARARVASSSAHLSWTSCACVAARKGGRRRARGCRDRGLQHGPIGRSIATVEVAVEAVDIDRMARARRRLRRRLRPRLLSARGSVDWFTGRFFHDALGALEDESLGEDSEACVTACAAFLGDLELVRMARECGHEWDAYTCQFAASNGHLECLKYAHENGCPWNEGTCASAAYSGNLECLKYAHEHGCPWNKSTCDKAAYSGNLECLKYAHECGCPWDEWTCYNAAKNGHLECLKYAHEHGCPWDEGTCACAAYTGHLGCLKYAQDHSAPESARYVVGWQRICACTTDLIVQIALSRQRDGYVSLRELTPAVNHFLRAWPELALPEDVIRRILFDADLKPMTPRARFSRMIALYATK